MDVRNADLDSISTACVGGEVAAVIYINPRLWSLPVCSYSYGRYEPTFTPLVNTPETEGQAALIVIVTGERDAAPHDSSIAHALEEENKKTRKHAIMLQRSHHESKLHFLGYALVFKILAA